MGRVLCKIPHEGKDYYLVWSTIVDAFITYGMSLEEFTEWMREEEGRRYMEMDHNRRMEKVEMFGTSSAFNKSPEELISLNHCGPKQQRITMEGIIYDLITRRPEDEEDGVTDEEMEPYLWPLDEEEE